MDPSSGLDRWKLVKTEEEVSGVSCLVFYDTFLGHNWSNVSISSKCFISHVDRANSSCLSSSFECLVLVMISTSGGQTFCGFCPVLCLKKVREHVSCSAVEYMALVGSGVIERIHASLVLLDNRI